MMDDEFEAGENMQRRAPDALAVVNEVRLMSAFKTFAANIAQTQLQRESALLKRVAALESRCKDLEARGAGVSVVADSVAIPGLDEVANMVARLNATLRAPMKPIYDGRGVLIGARRVE